MPKRLMIFIALLCVGITSCQTLDGDPIPEPANPYQLLVTFRQSPPATWPSLLSPGRAYTPGKEWEVPLRLRAKISRLAQRFELFEQKVWPIDSLELHCVVFAVERNRNLRQLLTDLKNHPDVVNAQPMNEFVLMGATVTDQPPQVYNDTHFTLQYGKHAENLRLLHKITRGDRIKVAVIDTTADLGHPDLDGQIARQYDYINNDVGENARSSSNTPGQHGTAMAGIIAAKADNRTGVVGLAPDARLYVYGACASDGERPARCNSLNIARALEQAIKDRIKVLNLSLAGPHDPLLEQLLEVAHKRGTIIIAAGNTRAKEDNFPASIQYVIGVEASPAEGEAVQESFGDWVNRPEKFSTQAGGGYQFFYGSSVSAASVSGVAALLRSLSSKEETLRVLQALVDGDCRPQHSSSASHVIHLLMHSQLCEPSTHDKNV